MIELEFMRFLPVDMRDPVMRIILLVIALVCIWLLRSVLTALILRPVLSLISRLAARQPEKTWLDQVDDMLHLPVNLLIVALGIYLASVILTPDRQTSTFVTQLTRSLVILALFVGFYRLTDIVSISSGQFYRVTGLQLDPKLMPFLSVGVKLLFVALAIVVLLQEWNYDVSGLIAGLGLGGLAISLAARDTVANLFGFSMIVSDRPFVVGEFIRTPEVEGIVESIGPRSTRIRQPDQGYVIVPNEKLAASAILNWSRLSRRWINFRIGVTYSTTSDQMRTLTHQIREMLITREAVDPDTVLVHFIEFGDSSLQVLVRCYVNIANWGAWAAEQEQIFLNIMDIVNDLGLSMAFPSRSLYIENMAFAMADGRYEIEKQPARRPDSGQTLPDQEPNLSFEAGGSSGDSEDDDDTVR